MSENREKTFDKWLFILKQIQETWIIIQHKRNKYGVRPVSWQLICLTIGIFTSLFR